MAREELRPIGTEFEITYPPCEYSTICETKVIRYRVTNHVKVARFIGDKEGILAESIEAISIQKFIIPNWYEKKWQENVAP